MQAFLSALQVLLGPQGVLTAPKDMAPYLTDWRQMFTGSALAVLRPASTDQVAGAVRLCGEHGVALVPQGGNTGLAGGATPTGPKPQVVLSLARMNRIRDIDPTGLSTVVEAGVILQTLREAVAAEGRLLPISIAAEGSTMIGGVLATNAGGVNVLRYGMARDFVLGLEVVLADGTVVGGLKRLRKDNAGFDWKQLFIGSEGLFGIITAAVLRLVPAPRYRVVALLSVPDLDRALAILRLFLDRIGETLTAFELISCDAMNRVEQHFGLSAPIAPSTWFLLVEASSALEGLNGATTEALAEAFEEGLLTDGTISTSESQAQALWALREHITEAEARSGKSLKHDVSLPVRRMSGFLDALQAQLPDLARSAQLNVFGHLGDGNLHVNIILDPAEWSKAASITSAVHDKVVAEGGSISAEHGLGQYRLAEFRRLTPKPEQDLVQGLKSLLDREERLNPGKSYRPAV